MNELELEKREGIVEELQRESELSDLKQHADKMIRGFESFNDLSSKRAIWELIQNACDLTDNCKVTIDYRDGKIAFTHNGEPFNTRSLTSLIKQVSGKYKEDNKKVEVGKYGTGFLTTHTFGRRFIIDSILQADDIFFQLDKFEVDRRPVDWKTLSVKIQKQKDKVHEVIRKSVTISKPQEFSTTFTYYPETEQEKKYIKESLNDLFDNISFVLTINERLSEVIIYDQKGVQTRFCRRNKIQIIDEREIDLRKTEIVVNDSTKVIFSLVHRTEDMEIILPVDSERNAFEFSENVSKLFLYFPLIGSENFGINYIINCNRFQPNEPRSGLHLNSNKDQLEKQEVRNRKLMEAASDLVFKFLSGNFLDVKNRRFFAKVNFERESGDRLLDEYFTKVQTLWNSNLINLPLVESESGQNISVSRSTFFKDELFYFPELFDTIYSLASIFWPNLPKKEEIKDWSSFVSKWGADQIQFVSHEDLIKKISSKSLKEFDKVSLQDYYKGLMNMERSSLFNDYPVLPNLMGDFCILNKLECPVDISERLVDLGKVLIPESIEKLLDVDFNFDFELQNYNRRNFSKDVKVKIDEIEIINKIPSFERLNINDYNNFQMDKLEVVNEEFVESLITFCKLTTNKDSKSKPLELVKIIGNYYGKGNELIEFEGVEKDEENLELRSVRRGLVKMFFNLLSLHNQGFVKENIYLFINISNCFEDSVKEVFTQSKIFPNQVYELNSISELNKDVDKSDEIKVLYNKVFDTEIRKKLIHTDFESFAASDSYYTSKYFTNAIEDKFFETDIQDINDHPFKDDILYIIRRLNEKKYKELFPRLEDKKARLMLDVVTNERTKDDIFSIITLEEDKLKKVGELIKKSNFEELLRKAETLEEEEKIKELDFQFKHDIGTRIENLILEKLDAELKDSISVKTESIQNGKDIVIYKNEKPVFLIEVKSRWSSQRQITMSKLQLEVAHYNKDKYALCSVDISKYTGLNDRFKLSLDEIIPLTKFVPNIGVHITNVLEPNINAEKDNGENVHLIDYRGVVPQKIIKKGMDISQFIDLLLERIEA